MSKAVIAGGPGIPAPLGPYSPAVRAGDLLFVSGQPGVDPATGALAGDTMAQQARQAFANVRAVLEAAGSSLFQVVNTTILLSDVADFAALNEAFGQAFPADPPARMTMQVGLAPGYLVSVGAVAAVES